MSAWIGTADLDNITLNWFLIICFALQCFMNSILQCLSHTQPLTDQLLKGSYVKIVNSSSSMKGRLIEGVHNIFVIAIIAVDILM